MEPTQMEAENFRRVQLTKYAFIYALNVPVQNNTTLPAILTIEEDADFLIERITGSAYGPTDVNGARYAGSTTALPAEPTIFPLAGTTNSFADRGLTVRLTDTGAGRTLTSGFVPLETMLTPGYGISMETPYPFKYWTRRNSKIQFDLRNRDTAVGDNTSPALVTTLYHFVSICLHGFKYV